MLYDPKWAGKREGLTVENLIRWLETKPKDRQYPWNYPGSCLIAQWLEHMGEINEIKRCNKSNYMVVAGSPFSKIALSSPYTYGAALKRARAILSDS